MPNPNRIDIPFASCELTVPDGPALYLCAAPGEVWARFASNALAFEQAHFPLHDQLIAQGAMAAAPDDADFALTLLNITKSRDETRAQIADAWRRTRVGGAIVISGDKTEGIERHLRDLKSMIAIDGSAAKAHGKVFWITKTEETPDGFADWTKAGEMSQMAEGFWTAPGMFSEGKVDRGSEALAARFSEKFTGDVADLGAGWGYLSAQLLATCPKITRVDLIEAHAGALAAAKRNVTSDRAQFLWADATQLSTRAYDLIVMNPPFHTARDASTDLGRAFITAASRSLRPRGRLLMVANRHLAYEATLKATFRTHVIETPVPGFKLIEARGPLAQRP